MVQKKNTPILLSSAADQAPTPADISPKRKRKVRQPAEMLVLEQRMMFDGAAASTAELTLESSTASPEAGQDNASTTSPSEPEVFVPQSVTAPASNTQTEDDEPTEGTAPGSQVNRPGF